MKAILISIQPKWVAKILNEQKSIEIRKTMPKCELPIDVYIYCTSHKNYHQSLALVYSDGTHTKTEYECDYYNPCVPKEEEKEYLLNGMVVGKFTLKNIYLAKYQKHKNANSKKANKLTCLTDEELDKYFFIGSVVSKDKYDLLKEVLL